MAGISKKFKSDVLSGTFGTVVAYAIGILLLPLITHYYKPEHIGAWQILLAFIGLLAPLATFRFENAIVLEKSNTVVSRLCSVIAINTVTICVLLIISAFLIGENSKKILNLDVSAEMIWLAIAGLIVQASFLTLTGLIVKQKNFKGQAFARVSGAVAIPAIAIATLGFFEASNITYTVAALSGLVIQSFLLYRWVDIETYPGIYRWRKAELVSAILKYRVYPFYMVPYALSHGIVWQITLMSFSTLFSISTVGSYTVSRQLVFMPVSLLTTGLNQVIFSYASSAPRYDKDVNNRIRKLLITIVNVAIPFAVVSFTYLPYAINFMLGDGWESVGVFSRWVLISAIALMLTSWLDRIFDVYGRQRLAVFLQVSSDVLILLVLLVCYTFNAHVLGTVIAISGFLALYNMIWLFIVLRLLKIESLFWTKLMFRISVIAITSFAIVGLIGKVLPANLALTFDLLLLVPVLYFAYIKVGGYL